MHRTMHSRGTMPSPSDLFSGKMPALSALFSGKIPSLSDLYAVYASVATTGMFLRTLINEFVPRPVREYLRSALRRLFRIRLTAHFTLVVEELCNGMSRNQIYDDAELYLSTKISPASNRLRIAKTNKDKGVTVTLERGMKVLDRFEGIDLAWRLVISPDQGQNSNFTRSPSSSTSFSGRVRYFELSFEKRHEEVVLGSYVPYVLERAKSLRDSERVLKMHTLGGPGYGTPTWESIDFEHPATFGTLAMEPDLKAAVMDDLDRFVKRREFYRKVGRAWKRGYLLYGPPGTGKSSLIAAMANYLKFDIYDLQLSNIKRDSELRKLLMATANRSILVIEDIDCSVDITKRRRTGRKLPRPDDPPGPDPQVTLSGLLNFIDGLWSTCGNERIIVFTTNHREKIDPALLRPGRMDMHVHMSYCTPSGFHILASNYLGVSPDHHLFPEIGALLETTPMTPAQVAEELMKSEDADVALEGLARAIKRKRMEVETGANPREIEKEGGGDGENLREIEEDGGGDGGEPEGNKRKIVTDKEE